MKEPKLGLTTEAKVIRVIDADTVEVEVSRRFPVRLYDPYDPHEDFNMPENNTSVGKKLTQYLKRLLPSGTTVTLFIPAGKNPLTLTDINSFNRIIGAFWHEGQSVARLLLDKYAQIKG